MRIIETAIHVDDIERAATFYERLFGFERMLSNDRICAFNVAPQQVFLLFKTGASLAPVTLPDGQMVPPHGGSGHLHFAFGVEPAELPGWERKLSEAGVAIEGKVHWELGGTSIYFRDPDGHLAELATPGIWKNY